jgi:putative transcription factor
LRVALTPSPPPRKPNVETELEVDPDYNVIVRQAREKLGLSQEALGMMIGVKPSLISHVETKKLKPDIALARKLMHQLKVDLLVPEEELDSPKRE